MAIKCVHCSREVEPQKPAFSRVSLIVWFMLGVIPGVIYIVINRSQPATKCPVCGNDVYR